MVNRPQCQPRPSDIFVSWLFQRPWSDQGSMQQQPPGSSNHVTAASKERPRKHATSNKHATGTARERQRKQTATGKERPRKHATAANRKQQACSKHAAATSKERQSCHQGMSGQSGHQAISEQLGSGQRHHLISKVPSSKVAAKVFRSNLDRGNTIT